MPPRLAARDFRTALNFNASGQNVSVADSASLRPTVITLAAWVKTSTLTGFQFIVTKNFVGGGGAGTSWWQLGLNASKITFRCTEDQDTVMSVTPLTVGVWYFIVATHDGTTAKIYLGGSGIPDNTATKVATPTQSAAAMIVGRRSDGYGWIGLLDEVRVWSTVLTGAQISALYYDGIVPTTGLVAEYKCNDVSGTNLVDLSGNTNTGTITGATFTSDALSKSRSLINPNLVRNGDFEIVPPFVAATTSAGVWMDGTATGNTNDVPYLPLTWASLIQGTGSNQYDSTVSHSGNASMKMSLTTSAANDRVGVTQNRNWANNPGLLISKIACIPVLPSTSYTLKFWWKGSGLATNQAFGRVMQVDNLGNAGSDAATLYGTPGATWLEVTSTFTTAASTAYLALFFQNGYFTFTPTGGSVVWVDDITLTPTTAVVR